MKSLKKRLWLPFAVAVFELPFVVGCGEDAQRNLARFSRTLITPEVDRGFHVVDGEAVFLDSNAAGGRIIRVLPEADAHDKSQQYEYGRVWGR